jgi:hypothetical protein
MNQNFDSILLQCNDNVQLPTRTAKTRMTQYDDDSMTYSSTMSQTLSPKGPEKYLFNFNGSTLLNNLPNKLIYYK